MTKLPPTPLWVYMSPMERIMMRIIRSFRWLDRITPRGWQ